MLICENCGKEFISSIVRKKVCSNSCWHKLNYKKNKEKIKLAANKWYNNNRAKKKAYQKKKYAETRIK